MKISVVTVVLNGAATIEQTLRSVHSQSHDDIEHIVIDGASTDGTLDILESYRDNLARMVSEPDNGLYEAMNKGIALASGEVIGFLNADDHFANDDVLARLAAVFEDETVEGCYGDLVYVDAGDVDRIIRYWTSRPYEPGLFEKGWMPAHPTFYVRRRIYEQYGDFDLSCRYQSDFELTARFMAVGGIRTVYIPEVMVRMRMGGTTNRSLANIWRGNLESYRACRNLGLNINPSWFITKFAMRIPQFFRKPVDGS